MNFDWHMIQNKRRRFADYSGYQGWSNGTGGPGPRGHTVSSGSPSHFGSDFPVHQGAEYSSQVPAYGPRCINSAPNPHLEARSNPGYRYTSTPRPQQQPRVTRTGDDYTEMTTTAPQWPRYGEPRRDAEPPPRWPPRETDFYRYDYSTRHPRSFPLNVKRSVEPDSDMPDSGYPADVHPRFNDAATASFPPPPSWRPFKLRRSQHDQVSDDFYRRGLPILPTPTPSSIGPTGVWMHHEWMDNMGSAENELSLQSSMPGRGAGLKRSPSPPRNTGAEQAERDVEHRFVQPGVASPADFYYGFGSRSLHTTTEPYPEHGVKGQDIRRVCVCGRTAPTYRKPDDPGSAALWCSHCAPAGTVPVLSMCQCGNGRPVFRLPGRPAYEARWCQKCPDKPRNAVEVKGKRCRCGNCQPNFGLPNEPPSAARWCSKCPDKPLHAVNVKNKRCECGSSQPSFGLAGEVSNVARWCAKCPSKPVDAIDVKHKRCLCGRSIPNFGLPGEPPSAARWCSKCPDKAPNAVDIKNKRCQCGRSQPSLGLPDDPPNAARWCSKCPNKPMNAIGVKSKRCECGLSQPSFGMPGEPATWARWCSKCPKRLPGAINLKSKRCLCGSSVPSFGLAGEPPSAARWCSKCPDKPHQAMDVKNKRCICGCGIPRFGLSGEGLTSVRWCSRCPTKPDEAVDMRS